MLVMDIVMMVATTWKITMTEETAAVQMSTLNGALNVNVSMADQQ